jgi:guanylate kinase
MLLHPSRPNAPRPLVVVIGPSGSGKSTLVRELHRRGVISVRPTWTTRPRRADEQAGSVEHHFVSEGAFAAVEAAGGFLGTAAMFGLPHRYGVPAEPAVGPGRVEVVMLRAPLVARFARVAAPFRVLAIEADPQQIRERLVARGCDLVELGARLDDNEREVRAGRAIADRVLVNDRTVAALADAAAAQLAVLTTEVAA